MVKTATHHSLTTGINDQAAFYRLLPLAEILLIYILLEAHFSEMSIAFVSVCMCIAILPSSPSIHPG